MYLGWQGGSGAADFARAVSDPASPSYRQYVTAAETAGVVDVLRTFDDYSGSPTQHTGSGWDNVTGLGSPKSGFLAVFGR